MLIDRFIEVMEQHRSTNQVARKVLAYLQRANAYEVGGVEALASYLQKRDTLVPFLQAALDYPDTGKFADEMLPFIWIEHGESGVLIAGSLTCVRIFFLEDDGDRVHILCGYRDKSDGYWRYVGGRRMNADSESFFVQPLLRINVIAYLAANPRHKVVALQPSRCERKNKRGTKVLKPARKLVRTIIIDGVERVVTHQGVTYHIHAKGWHPRRHKVGEFSRRCASGKVVKVRAHERGDESLGYVPWYDTTNSEAQPRPTIRYKVQPDKSFYDDDGLFLQTGA